MARSVVLFRAAVLSLAVAFPPLGEAADPVLQRLVKQLASRKPADRVEAVQGLGRLGVEEAAAPLGAALSDADRGVRAAAASALWRLGEKASPAKEMLVVALDDNDMEVVVLSAGALETLGEESATLAPARRRALASGDLRIRFEAARGLVGLEPGPALLPHLLGFLEREAERGEDLTAEYRSRDAARDNVQRAERALQRLIATGDAGLVQPLLTRLAKDGPGQASILQVASELPDLSGGWDQALARGMASANASTRRAAARLAGTRLEPEQVAAWLPAATRALADADEATRGSALRAVTAAGGLAASAAPALVTRLTAEPAGDLRQRVAEALAAVGDRSQPVTQGVKAEVANLARPALARAAIQDAEGKVRREAVNGLDRLALPAEEAVVLLAGIARESRDDEVVWQALRALRNRGREAAPVLGSIKELGGHRSSQVADYATTIARELENDLAGPAGVARRPVQREVEASPAARRPDPAAEARGLAVLRRRGAEVSETALQQALMSVDAELVGALLDAGMSPSHPFPEVNGRQPLHLLFFFPAACNSAIRPTPEATHAVVDLLLARGAEPNGQDEMGNTPLMFAADRCDAAIIGKLLAGGAKHDARNSMGMAALEMAMWSGNDGLQALIDAGARLKPETAKAYAEAYQSNPKALELIRKATAAK